MKKPKTVRTLAQNKHMWALANELGVGEDGLRDVVHHFTEQRSTSILTVAQARQVIKALLEYVEGNETPLPQPSPARGEGDSSSPLPLKGIIPWRERTKVRGDLISQRQQVYIYSLYEQLGWNDSKRRVGFTKKLLKGKAWPQTNKDANKLINALKSMLKRNKGGAYDRNS